ncbi:FkbM family methyltransferase [Nonlabens xiamenensis]|uniref:FkbM family methyltransferase n=1 Tax=Nonlabens xiamenensis TaxID=2341043 RepID=UPI000F6079EF|nr:FkbM family methyltransferase [Nonlabens xiamenensis]
MRTAVNKRLRQARKLLYRFKGYYPAKLLDQRFKVGLDHIGFWKVASRGQWEPETLRILDQHLDANSLFLDIGAWIGPTVLYAARKCKEVICFEPDPIAFQELRKNIRLNNFSNVQPFQAAVSDQNQISRMSSLNAHLGDSMTSLLADPKTQKQGFDALVLSWHTIEELLVNKHPQMIKIDVEGSEFALIPAMATYLKKFQPTLLLSIHPELIADELRQQKIQELIGLLEHYPHCFNEKMEEIQISSLADPKYLNGYPAFLFRSY